MSPAQPGTQGHGDDTVERVERMLHEPEASAGEHRGRDPWPAAAAKHDGAGPALKISCGDVTLPTHSWISTADREEILRLLERYDRARSSLG